MYENPIETLQLYEILWLEDYNNALEPNYWYKNIVQKYRFYFEINIYS